MAKNSKKKPKLEKVSNKLSWGTIKSGVYMIVVGLGLVFVDLLDIGMIIGLLLFLAGVADLYKTYQEAN